MKLSHSAANIYKECPTKYKYHYIDRLRSTEIFSALIWGLAIDKGIEALLKNEDYVKKFIDTWSEQTILGKLTNLKDNINIRYIGSDYNSELLTIRDYKEIEDQTGLEQTELLEILYNIINNKPANVNYYEQTLQDKRLLNVVSWMCLKNKGLLLLESLKEEFLPRIEKVITLQEKIELVNEEGDSIVGFTDAILKLKDIQEPVIIDFKTTSKRYKLDAVETSDQLSLYAYALSDKYETRKAGFVVLNKKLRNEEVEKTCTRCGKDGLKRRHLTCDAIVGNKRCGGTWKVQTCLKGDIQVLINDVKDSKEKEVLENFEVINKLIKNGTFTKNLESCEKHYGKMVIKCAYFNKCHHGSDEGLVKVE